MPGREIDLAAFPRSKTPGRCALGGLATRVLGLVPILREKPLAPGRSELDRRPYFLGRCSTGEFFEAFVEGWDASTFGKTFAELGTIIIERREGIRPSL